MQSEYDKAREFAKWQFKMGSRQPDGSTLREQLQAAWKMSGKKPIEFEEEPELPELFYESWGWFLKLHNRRTSNGFGINAILYSEIKAYFELIEYHPQLWELQLIEIFDEVALEAYSEDQKKQKQLQEQKSKSKTKK